MPERENRKIAEPQYTAMFFSQIYFKFYVYYRTRHFKMVQRLRKEISNWRVHKYQTKQTGEYAGEECVRYVWVWEGSDLTEPYKATATVQIHSVPEHRWDHHSHNSACFLGKRILLFLFISQDYLNDAYIDRWCLMLYNQLIP